MPMSPYPIGWYSVCDSDELAAGELRSLNILGREFVVARDASGAPRAFDAYCPHLGAHLGHGGAVVGGSLRCPFHHWHFDTVDGRCTKIPYAKRIPPGAALEAYPTQERNGLVLMYFDPEGKPPYFEVDEVEELRDPEWTQVARLAWKMPTRANEVLENLFDTAHLRTLHGADEIPLIASPEEMPGVIRYEARGDDASSNLKVDMWGLGVQRIFYQIEVPVFELDTLTPLGDDVVEARTRLYVRNLGSDDANQAVGAAVAKELDAQVQADLAIFEHKRYLDRPLLCDGDGPIPTFRNWAAQFYRDAPAASSAR